MRIYVNVKFKGARGECIEKALIDTGAEISVIPLEVARKIGAWRTNQKTTLIGVHKQARTLPLGVLYVFFPSLNYIGGKFPVAISDVEEKPLIGMDILKPLGITIDTKTHKLLVRNEIWEAFKELAAWGVLFYAGIKILDSLFEQK